MVLAAEGSGVLECAEGGPKGRNEDGAEDEARRCAGCPEGGAEDGALRAAGRAADSTLNLQPPLEALLEPCLFRPILA